MNTAQERTFRVVENRALVTTTDFGKTKSTYRVVKTEDKIKYTQFIRYNGVEYYLTKVEHLEN